MCLNDVCQWHNHIFPEAIRTTNHTMQQRLKFLILYDRLQDDILRALVFPFVKLDRL